jgi:UDP-glucose:tetrahydrobiopterin glucosyltransferase
MSRQLKLLFLSTPVGALGSGIGGGVELTLYNLAQEMHQRGHQVQIVAPTGSKLALDVPIQEILGNCQVAAQTQSYDVPVCMPENPVLANMCEYVRQVEEDYDLIVNFAFDWLPFFLTSFYQRPVAHFISMGSLSSALDQVMGKMAQQYPRRMGVYTQAQANTFPFADTCRILGSGVDLSLYEYSEQSENCLAWLGRIAPEKALEDALAAAEKTGIPLRIFGKIQDEAYWHKIQRDYPNAPFKYMGFLSTQELQQELSQCRALLMTPRWIEAFGNVAIEALACGVPVIAYNRGGPGEIVRDGETGFLVEPDSVAGLLAAIERIPELDRAACRRQAEKEYSLKALGDRFEAWFREILEFPV